MAAVSATSGCLLTIRSTSKDEMFSPRRLIASFIRSWKKRNPFSSMWPRSPLWNQRLRNAVSVASGRPS